MENTSVKYLEFSILTIVKRSNVVSRTVTYSEVKKKPGFDSLSESDFNYAWNELVNNKCLLYIDEAAPEKGVTINPHKSCLIIYGYKKYKEESKKELS